MYIASQSNVGIFLLARALSDQVLTRRVSISSRPTTCKRKDDAYSKIELLSNAIIVHRAVIRATGKDDHKSSFRIYLHDHTKHCLSLWKHRPMAVFFMYIQQMSDKTLIMVRFIALAKTHLSRQRSAYQLASFVRPSSIYLTTCQADTLKYHIRPGICSNLAYKLERKIAQHILHKMA